MAGAGGGRWGLGWGGGRGGGRGLTTVCNVSGATFTMGFFMGDFMDTLDVSRSALSLAWAVAMLGTALCGPLVGRAIDLRGPKLVMAVTSVFFVAALLWISKLSSLYEIFVMFFLARMGTTSLAAAAQNANSQWWVKYRARQMALANALGSVSFVYPSLLLLLREEFGWRGSWLVQGVAVLVIFSVIVFFLLDRPELFDLLPDGGGGNGYGGQISVEMGDMTALVDTVRFQQEAEPREGEPKETETETREELTNDPLEVTIEGGPLDEIHWRWQDALRTAWFWLFCTGIFLSYSFWSGFNFHFMEIAVDRGFSPADTSWVFPLVTISALVVCLTTGFSMDKLRNKSLTIVAGLLLCCFSLGCLLLVTFVDSIFVFNVFGLLYGSYIGLFGVAIPTVVASIFGRVDLGTIQAVASGAITLSLGLGPLFFGIVKDFSGSFDPALIFLMAGTAATALGLFLLGTPSPPLIRLSFQS